MICVFLFAIENVGFHMTRFIWVIMGCPDFEKGLWVFAILRRGKFGLSGAAHIRAVLVGKKPPSLLFPHGTRNVKYASNRKQAAPESTLFVRLILFEKFKKRKFTGERMGT